MRCPTPSFSGTYRIPFLFFDKNLSAILSVLHYISMADAKDT